MAEVHDVLQTDYEDLARFLSGFENETRDASFWKERFAYWWDRNPAFSRNPQRGWVLRDKDAIVGFLGNIPSLFRSSKQDLVVFNATTWRVQREYRSFSLGLLFKQIEQAKQTILFDSTPTKELEPILKTLKFRLSRNEELGQFSVLMLDVRKVVEQAFGRAAWARGLSWILHPAVHLFQNLKLMSISRKNGSGAVRLDRADAAFDALWDRTKDLRLTNVRNSEAVHWYCFGSEQFRKYLFGYYEKERLAGYLVFGVISWRNLKVFECLDMWVEPEKGYALKPMLRKAKEQAREIGCDLVRVRRPGGWLGGYLRGLITVTKPHTVYLKIGSELKTEINPTNSYLFCQGDYGL